MGLANGQISIVLNEKGACMLHYTW